MKNASSMPRVNVAALASSSVPSGIVQMSGDEDRGPSRSEQRQQARVMSEIRDTVASMHSELRQQIEVHDERIEHLMVRQSDYEQLGASRSRGRVGGGATMSWGEVVTESEGYRSFVSNSCKGNQRIPVSNALTSVGTSGGALVAPGRDPEGVPLPRRRLTVRALLGKGETGSNLVEYFKEKTFVNYADMVAEGAQKPETEITYELANAPVRTIAHWIPATRQLMDDAPQLRTMVDTSLRYGLAMKEEQQFLFGDGTGQNLHGMMPQASAFETARILPGDTRLDVLRHAASQAAEADLPASGVILNTRDFWNLLGVKDADGNYILGVDTFSLWNLPVVYANAMPLGKFLVGAFEAAAQIYDRMEPEVLISSEDRDNFVKNMLTIRGESRLAFAVKRAAALIKGDLPPLETTP